MEENSFLSLLEFISIMILSSSLLYLDTLLMHLVIKQQQKQKS
jgi:hypothetical protein